MIDNKIVGETLEEMKQFKCDIPPGTKVLVTGATGFTGSVLLRKLIAANLKVNAIARLSSRIEQFKDLPVNWFRGDVFDEATVAAATAGCEYIFHVAAAFREAKLVDADYYNVHVLSTKLLAEAALRNANFRRFIHVSTMGVHGHIASPPADENYPFGPGDIYQRTKAEAEIWLREFATQNNLPFVVIRPAGIFGPGDRRLLKVFKMAKKQIVPVLGFGKCLYHLIHVDDLANVIILAATHPAALNEVFICGNEQHTSLVEMLRIAGSVYKTNPAIVRLPVTPFLVLGDICEVVCKPFGIEPPIYRRRVAFYTKDRAFSTKKLRDRLGYVAISNDEGIKRTAEWYRDNKWI